MKKTIAFIGKHFFGACVVLFLLFICIFSEHSYYRLHQLKRQQSKLMSEIESYRDSIAEYEAKIDEVSGNSAEMEKFAREVLMMKKTNEDVYIIK